ncbi:MAG: hypothetical protein HFF17_14315 [Oscillospiraceae bacterium]|jgi:hypothetical protein|nr:hypothetical protein [Oscillospiraceae bacterium]
MKYQYIRIYIAILLLGIILLFNSKKHTDYFLDFAGEMTVEVVGFSYCSFIARAVDNSYLQDKEFQVMLGIGHSIEGVEAGDLLKIAYRIDHTVDCPNYKTSLFDYNCGNCVLYAVIIEPLK